MIASVEKDSDGVSNVTLHKKLKQNQFHVTKEEKILFVTSVNSTQL